MSKFSKEEGGEKYVVISLYGLYILIFSVITLYPILATIKEAEELKEEMSETIIIPEEDWEMIYLKPKEECPVAPYEYCLIKAKQAYNEEVR